MEPLLIKNSFISSFKPLLLAIAFLIVSFIGGEFLMRLTLFGKDAVIHPDQYEPRLFLASNLMQTQDPQTPHYLKPNLNIRFQGKQFTTNEYGFREGSFEIKPSKDITRIVSLGDSYAMGWGLHDNEHYSHRLEILLNQSNKIKYEVLNLGVMSYRNIDNIRAYKIFTHSLEPNIVLLHIDINTLDRPPRHRPTWKNLVESPFGERVEHISNIKLFLKQNSFFYHFAYGFQSQLLKGFLPNWKHRIKHLERKRKMNTSNETTNRILLEQFIGQRYEDGIPVVLLSLKKPKHLITSKSTKQIADAKLWVNELPGCYLIDANTTLANSITLKETVYPGNGHPNAKAHQIYATAIHEELSKIIEITKNPNRQ